MPRKPPRPCSTCGALTRLGEYCARHRPTHHQRRREAAYRQAAENARLMLGQRCPLCRRTMTRENPPNVDHVVRLRDDGTNAAENLRVLCFRCNRARG